MIKSFGFDPIYLAVSRYFPCLDRENNVSQMLFHIQCYVTVEIMGYKDFTGYREMITSGNPVAPG